MFRKLKILLDYPSLTMETTDHGNVVRAAGTLKPSNLQRSITSQASLLCDILSDHLKDTRSRIKF